MRFTRILFQKKRQVTQWAELRENFISQNIVKSIEILLVRVCFEILSIKLSLET
jgi:hypothetical protein